VIREIRGAATRSPNPRAESAAPGLSKIGDEEFWRGFQSEVPRRSGVREGDLYNQSLNFLLNKGAGSDFPQFVAAALIFISAAGLQQSVVDVDLRRGFLDALLANSDRFVAFARGNSEPRPFDRATDVKTREGKFFKLNVKGIALLGCFEFFEDELHVTQLVKADWSPAKGGRCQ
jgi:hypothetical protein